MAFENLPPSKPAPKRAKSAQVFCVGWRAFVNWPPRSHSTLQLPLTDPNGKPLNNDLADGQAVEIVSWRPRSREGLLYQVKRLTDGTEWWVESAFLRRSATPDAIVESPVVATPR